MSRTLPSDVQRQLENIVVIGRVIALDTEKTPAMVKVQLDTDQQTNWIPIASQKAGGAFLWFPPEIGEQGIVFSPGGQLQSAVYWGGIHYLDNKHKFTEKDFVIKFRNGDSIAHLDKNLSINITGDVTANIKGSVVATVKGDVTANIKGDVSTHVAGTLDAVVSGDVSLKAPKVKLVADVSVIGDIDVDGKIESTGDIIAAKVSLISHPTSGVMPGAAISGPPVAGGS